MSSATIITALAAPPTPTTAGGKEILEALAATQAQTPLQLLLRVRGGSGVASAFSTKTTGDLVIVSGDLILDDDGNQGILYCRVCCDAAPSQYLNEVTIVGRLGPEGRVASSGKSACRSVAVNRFVAGEEVTDWYPVRGFGYTMEKLQGAPKGALVSVSGSLDQRTSKEGSAYIEIKARTLRIHGKPKGGGNPAAGTTAHGYDHSDFTGESADDMPFDWS